MLQQEPLTIVVADDLPLVSEALASLCEGLSRSAVLAQCHDGEEALRSIEILQPDIALLV